LGHALYVHYGIDPQVDYETNILLADVRAWFRSESSIRMLEGLGWPWRLAAGVRILPGFVRDPAYDFIARNRLGVFGQRDDCDLPCQQHADGMLAARSAVCSSSSATVRSAAGLRSCFRTSRG